MSEGPNIPRLELGVVLSLLCSAGSVVFGVGVLYADLRNHESRIAKIETKVDSFGERLARIDANVEFLAEQARDQRMRDRSVR